LFAPEGDALFFYRRIAEGAADALAPGAPVLVEIAAERADEVVACFKRSLRDVELIPDLAGRPRVVIGRVPT
jgi:methylase of polypeptide subunit release factors